MLSLLFDEGMVLLSQLNQGQVVRIVSIKGNDKFIQRLAEIGILVNEKIQVIQKIFFGNNIIIASQYGNYSLRSSEAEPIKVEVLNDSHL